jgi:DNA replication initiation complex subunit (GINS family)
MYTELYAAWRREIEEEPLGGLPSDFYTRLADYLRRINEENKLFDKKSVKLNLLDHEAQNVKRMLEELLWTRYKKLVKTITQSQKLPSDLLTVEESKMCESFVSFAGTYQKFANNLIQGQTIKVASVPVDSRPDSRLEPKVETVISHKRVALRFIKNIPTIIGADMKTYGPFVAEDVASIPLENAKMLVKQGLAVSIEVS